MKDDLKLSIKLLKDIFLPKSGLLNLKIKYKYITKFIIFN